ncbi:MAG: hypothetical protein RLZZ200_1967 [Pseudomonadota bacterium]|jgi:hypothetical protein
MDWLLLVTNLPGGNQTLRIRIWRALKAAGAGALRDGVYVLPASDAGHRLFAEHCAELSANGGSGEVIGFSSVAAAQTSRFRALFDRSPDYARFMESVSAFRKGLRKSTESLARRRLAQFGRELEALTRIDYFSGEARDQAEAALADLVAAADGLFTTDEPHAVSRAVPKQDRRKYRSRTWATRERPWIDRVCSAWLIRRFIDEDAKFRWLKKAADCPKSAVGFDFDGAEFTHVGSRVTFEVLLASFGLESDTALVTLGRVVHFLDVGGIPVPEAAGLAAVVSGARELHADDSALLAAVSPVLDSLYAAYAARKEI